VVLAFPDEPSRTVVTDKDEGERAHGVSQSQGKSKKSVGDRAPRAAGDFTRRRHCSVPVYIDPSPIPKAFWTEREGPTRKPCGT